jgi:hypothetical protein
VLSEILTRHVGNASVEKVFPGYANDPKHYLNLIRA